MTVPSRGGPCPRCKAVLPPGAVLCVGCGLDLRTGKAVRPAGVGTTDRPPPQWFCAIDDVEHGPLTAQDLRKMARGGKLKPTDRVRGPAHPGWVAAGKVKGLEFGGAGGPGRRCAVCGAAMADGAMECPGCGRVPAVKPVYDWQPAAGGDKLDRAFRVWVVGFYVVPVLCGLLVLGVALVAFSRPVGGDPQAERARDTWVVVNRVIALFGAASWCVGVVAFWVLVHRMWQQVQDGHAVTTPGKAVALCFVPLFNLYWVSVALGRLPESLNGFAARHGVGAPQASGRLMGAYCLMFAASHLPFLPFVLALPALVVLFLGVRSAKTAAVAIAQARPRLDGAPR